FARSLARDRPANLRSRHRHRLSIRLRASRLEHFVGARARPPDDGVRNLVDGSELLPDGLVGLLALGAQTLMGLVALRQGLGGFLVQGAVSLEPEEHHRQWTKELLG